MEGLKAIIPLIPGIIMAGKSVWNELVKPLLLGSGYNITKELEQEMLQKEIAKDIEGITKKLNEIANNSNQTVNSQFSIGDGSQQIGNITGNGNTINITNVNKNNGEKNKTDLSEMAFILLKEMAQDTFGQLSARELIGGNFDVNTNCKKFGSTDARKKAELKEAIQELEENKLIQPKNNERKIFNITANGYNVVETEIKTVKKNEILNDENGIDVKQLLPKKNLDKFCLIDILFETPELIEFNTAEILKEYKRNALYKNDLIKPYIFQDCWKKEHTPVIIYESNDYLTMFSNWAIYDKLQIQNNYLRYTFCEMSDHKGMIFITGSLLLGSIYSILTMIMGTLFMLKKRPETVLKLSIKGNEKMIFRMQNKLMDINSAFTETYSLKKDEKHEINFKFSEINQKEINIFTNRFLNLFTSENAKSTQPFLSTSIDETKKFQKLLMNYEHYFAIDN